MRDDAVFSMSKQIKPKFLPLSRNLWSIIITYSHNASEESSSLLKNPDTNTKLNYSSESKLCCSGHQLYLYLKWSPAVSMQNPMALNSTLHFSGDTSVLHSTRNLKRGFFFCFPISLFLLWIQNLFIFQILATTNRVDVLHCPCSV